MKAFKDNNGVEWLVSVTADTARDVRDLLKVELLEVEDAKIFQKLSADVVLLVDVLYVVCKQQAEKRGVTDRDFGRALGGDSIESATDSLMEAICDFFPQSRRKVLRTMIEKMKAVDAAMMAKAQAIVDGMSVDKLEALISSSIATDSAA